MAQRPVFRTLMTKPFYERINVELELDDGGEVCNKQSNISELHRIFGTDCPSSRILEISTKSLQPLGVELSAFNLQKLVPSLGRKTSVETVYQGGKIFKNGGPFTDLYNATSRAAKSDERLTQSGELTGYYFEGLRYPLSPIWGFFDWIYINALLENPVLSEELLQFDAFTDIEFDPQTGINCQAQAAAVFVSLKKAGKDEAFESFESFLRIVNH